MFNIEKIAIPWQVVESATIGEAKPLENYRALYQRSIHYIKKIFPLQPGAKILEIGSGSGWFTILAAQDGYDATGLDRWAIHVECSQRRASKAGVSPRFIAARADEPLEFPSASFDVCIANAVLEHIPRYQKVLAEAARVLRPGGILIVSTTNRAYPISGEVNFPLFPYLPLGVQKYITVAKFGEDYLESGMAWNHFTYPGLRKKIAKLGFVRIYDIFDLAEVEEIQSPGRRWLLKYLLPLAKRHYSVRWLLYFTLPSTGFYAIKNEI